jgi:hypothetical protein
VTTRTSAALVLISVALAAACIPPRPSPSPALGTPTPAPTFAPSPAVTGGSPSPSGPTSSSAGVIVDPSLLSVLPDAIGGVPVNADPATAADIAAEGSIAPFVSALALATAFGPAATDDAGDYVVVTVARLRPNTFSDLFFRGWRDTFDRAVCDQAGGVAGSAETEIGGRQTFIGTCAGGVHTYHVHLTSGDLIVSMQGLGPGRFGERIVEGLTE